MIYPMLTFNLYSISVIYNNDISQIQWFKTHSIKLLIAFVLTLVLTPIYLVGQSFFGSTELSFGQECSLFFLQRKRLNLIDQALFLVFIIYQILSAVATFTLCIRLYNSIQMNRKQFKIGAKSTTNNTSTIIYVIFGRGFLPLICLTPIILIYCLVHTGIEVSLQVSVTFCSIIFPLLALGMTGYLLKQILKRWINAMLLNMSKLLFE